MKKVFIMMVFVISILSACNSSQLSFTEVENVPDNVQDKIDSSLQLQLISDGKKGSYIILQSDGDVKAVLDSKGDTVTLKFDVSNSQVDNKIQNVYFLTTDKDTEVIEVLVNGESTPFDNVVA